MTKPFLSILIPTYNRADMTFEAVESVGMIKDVEIVVVDDCSDISEYKKMLRWQPLFENMILYRNHENLGMTRNFNRCMELATGDWFGLIGSDDTYKPKAVHHAMALMMNCPEPALIVYSRSIDTYVKLPGVNTVREMRLPSGSGNFWHRKIYEDLGGFDERLTFSPDVEYWYRMAAKYPVVYSGEKYSIYREHENNIMWSMWRQRDEMIKQIKLVTRLNMVHRGEDTEDLDVVAACESKVVWDTISYILRKTCNMPDKSDIFDMYLPKAEKMAVTQDRKDTIAHFIKVKEGKIETDIVPN